MARADWSRPVVAVKTMALPSGDQAASISSPSLSRSPPKPGDVAKRRAGQQVARRGRVAEHLQHQGRAAFVEPAVPVADRERVIGARAVLSRLLLVDALLVVGVRQRAGIRHAGEQDGLAVRAPDGPGGAGRDVRHAFGLAAARDVEHVDLRLVLAVALGREGEAARVRAPGRARFRAIREREPARRRAAVRRDEPEVARLRAVVVGGLRDGYGDEPAVRRKHRRSDPLHEPEVLVRDRVLRDVVACRRRARGKAQDGTQAMQFHRTPHERHWRAQTFCSNQGWSGTRSSLNSSPRPCNGVQSV